MGGKFLHPIGRVIVVATNYLPSPSDGKTSSSLGESTGRKPTRYKPSLKSTFNLCTAPSSWLAMTTSLMRRSRAWSYYMAENAAIGKVYKFKLL